ncbi:hypothetical protein [uncultured Pseudacidovorax sp.]|uniref:hypothetical protein n=1 Tax=uncultured Pseudacidovorax sp. TaxID=679313 RepID=UPI0025E5CE18|nr:hypothetical protein [uncultured Pseudacidovorax sp.]
MAKPAKPTREQEGEISFSMVKFTMKGSDATLQKGLDSIKAAFEQAGFVVAPSEVHHLRSNAQRQLPPLNGAVQVEVEAEEVEDASEVENASAASTPAPRKPSAPRKVPNYKIMRDLAFDDVTPTLAEFVAEKRPETHLDRYLCVAYWFKHHKDTEDLTVEHFFTAYMHYSWSLPTNAATPIGDLRHQRRQLFIAGTAPATSTISNGGERRVMEMGKAEA